MRLIGVFGLAALLLSRVSADIAHLGDGTRVTGQLTADSEGRLRFLQSNKTPASQPHLIQFTPNVAERAEWSGHRIWLGDGQCLSGSLVKVTEKEVVLRVSAKETVTIPRPEVRAVSRAGTHGVVLGDDFEQASTGWHLAGGAARSKEQARSGSWALKLARPGQSARGVLPEPVAAGRLDFAFSLVGSPARASWQLQATFGEEAAEKTVSVLLAGDAAEDLPDAVPKKAGWHRLSLRFQASYLLIGLDRQVVWSSPERTRYGALRKLSFACVGRGDDAKGAVFIDDLTVDRGAPVFSPTPGIVPGDALRMPSGDQLFGALAGADRGKLDFRGKFAGSEFAWDEVAGVELHADAVPAHRTVGMHARVRFFAGDPAEPDELVGVVAALDETLLTLDHAVLGRRAIERRQLLSLRPLFHGVRQELGHETHHLGETGTKVAGVRTAAEGIRLKKSFRVEIVPREAALAVSVAWPGVDSMEAARADVLLNGAKVEALDRHVRRTSAEFRRIRLALPADAVRVGDNVLELRVSPPSDGGRVGHCLIRQVVLELSR